MCATQTLQVEFVTLTPELMKMDAIVGIHERVGYLPKLPILPIEILSRSFERRCFDNNRRFGRRARATTEVLCQNSCSFRNKNDYCLASPEISGGAVSDTYHV